MTLVSVVCFVCSHYIIIGILEERPSSGELGAIWSTILPAGVMVAGSKEATYTSISQGLFRTNILDIENFLFLLNF